MGISRRTSGMRWVGCCTLIVPFVLSFFTRFAPGTFSGSVAALGFIHSFVDHLPSGQTLARRLDDE
ncbi:hypothetical protein K7711_08940 [Nocardia sp. CA2R105]|uniref:hypothetical protein n=1 Tax=Nocardia coffeae TaxID=2873381 RepID=UPI001CA6C12D|nr:hypothetical protein [Nocardia coffeae]MBY8856599.1 hypothetical protein [Nocardia coffeae]